MIERDSVIEVSDLHVEYKTLSGKKIQAVRGLSLQVRAGEVIGFIGPNGAGKTSTLKVLMGFQRPLQGNAWVLGEPAGSLRARQRIGFLPEVALYYPFMTARETLRLYGKLAGMPGKDLEQAIDVLLRQVGLKGRDREPLRGFSKGMLQRVGIAQAIMGDPDLLILDEVTSGLDPVARYDVRKILLDFKARGKTVFFSSHELNEVAMLCDRIILVDEGRLLMEKRLDTLLIGLRHYILTAECRGVLPELPEGVVLRSVHNGSQSFLVETPEAKDALEHQLAKLRLQVQDVREEQGALEDYFVRTIGHKVS